MYNYSIMYKDLTEIDPFKVALKGRLYANNAALESCQFTYKNKELINTDWGQLDGANQAFIAYDVLKYIERNFNSDISFDFSYSRTALNKEIREFTKLACNHVMTYFHHYPWLKSAQFSTLGNYRILVVKKINNSDLRVTLRMDGLMNGPILNTLLLEENIKEHELSQFSKDMFEALKDYCTTMNYDYSILSTQEAEDVVYIKQMT